MSVDDPDWLNHNDIARWAQEWAADPEKKFLEFKGHADPMAELKNRLARGDFRDMKAKSVEAFIRRSDEASHKVSEVGKAEREERAVKAAETSATAATASAASAKDAAKWARWAVVVAVVALALAAWPYIEPRLH